MSSTSPTTQTALPQGSPGWKRQARLARLQKLTDHGILERRAYTRHPPRYEYHLTEKGRALFPVITVSALT